MPIGGPNRTPIDSQIENPLQVEHVFAEKKDRMDLFIRTVGIARARVKIGPRQSRL